MAVDNEFEASLYEIVITNETNSSRFETFCKRVVSQLEGGQQVLTTTTSWDLGRDAVGYGQASGLYVCTSLRDDADTKMLEDLARLQETTKGVKIVYFCSSQRLSEHKLDSIQAALANEVDFQFEIRCLGAHQLAQMMADNVDLQSQYKAEISNVLTTIDTNMHSENDVRGLRLALMTSTSEQSHVIRRSIYEAAVLDALTNGGRTIAKIGLAIANGLGLGRSLRPQALLPHLAELEARHLIERAGEVYQITQSGTEQRTANERAAAERLMAGRREIQRALEAAIGASFLSDEYARIWNVFEERLDHYLYHRGHAIVDEVSALLDPDEATAEVQGTLSFVDEIAEAVGATSSSLRRRQDLAQAVRDLFSDRTGPAADWLVQVCAGFVAACTMGLESESANAVGRLLAKTTLVLDTDVVLSLFGSGEPEHEAVKMIIEGWQKNRGKVLVGEPVLQEAAHHAWIAQRDFNQVEHLLPGTGYDRLHVIENAFVRSFAAMLAEGRIRRTAWRDYINQYRGVKSDDHQKIAANLRGDFQIQMMPPRSSQLGSLAQQVSTYALALAEEDHPTSLSKIDRDKATRDAELYTAFVHLAETVKEADPSASCILVSSSHRLSRIEAKFRRSGEKQMVISIGGALLLVSMLPDVALGLTAMKAFLFDERRQRFSSDLERTLVRMVKSSNEVSLPWAQRTMLMREVRERLLKNAISEGIPKAGRGTKELETEALKPANLNSTIQVLRDSLDALAIDSKLERENRELKAQIQKLQLKLEKGQRA